MGQGCAATTRCGAPACAVTCATSALTMRSNGAPKPVAGQTALARAAAPDVVAGPEGAAAAGAPSGSAELAPRNPPLPRGSNPAASCSRAWGEMLALSAGVGSDAAGGLDGVAVGDAARGTVAVGIGVGSAPGLSSPSKVDCRCNAASARNWARDGDALRVGSMGRDIPYKQRDVRFCSVYTDMNRVGCRLHGNPFCTIQYTAKNTTPCLTPPPQHWVASALLCAAAGSLPVSAWVIAPD